MPHKDPHDPTRWIYTEAEQKRERACQNAKHCACDHLHCREGWLDTADDRDLAVHCPHCLDAANMAAEAVVKPAARKWKP